MRFPILDRILLELVRRSHSAAQRLTLTLPVDLEGLRLNVPVVDGIGVQNLFIADHDRPLAGVARRVLDSTPGAVLDVGCNIGHFMELCLLADPTRPYVGFDPSLACCSYLDRFIRENGLENHWVFPLGLGDRFRVERLRSGAAYDVCATFAPEACVRRGYERAQLAPVEPGDAVVEALGFERVALIKIDVEGWELEVLRGLEKTLRMHRPYVIFEVLRYTHLGRAGGPTVVETRRRRARALERFFERRDFALYKIRRSGELTRLEHLELGDSADPKEMDYLALPREREEAFLERRQEGARAA